MSGFVTSEIWQQYFDAGMRAGKLADYDQAESNFRAAIAMAPDEPYPHYELGYTKLLQRDYEGFGETRLAEQVPGMDGVEVVARIVPRQEYDLPMSEVKTFWASYFGETGATYTSVN